MKITLSTAALALTASLPLVSAHGSRSSKHERFVQRRHHHGNHAAPARRQVDLSSSTAPVVSKNTIGDIVAARNATDGDEVQQKHASLAGSPYLISKALEALLHSNQVETNALKVAKRGEGEQSYTTSATATTDNEDNEECAEDDEDDDDGDEQCEEDDEDEDDEECDAEDDEAEDEEDDCDESGSGNAAVDGAVNLVTKPTASTPSDLAEGALTAEKGCTAFAKAAAGDSCYKLLGDKDQTKLDNFYKNNPSVNANCRNLQIGVSYCISSGDAPAASEPAKGAAREGAVESSSSSSAAAAATKAADKPAEEKPVEQKPAPASVSSSSSSSYSKPAEPTKAAAPAPAPAPAKEDKPAENKPAPATAQYHGKASYYYQHGNKGACGKANGDDAFIVALHPSLYNGGARCGSKVQLTNGKTGKTIEAVVADLCPSCEDKQIDLSDGLFKALGNGADGIFMVDYSFV